MKPCYVTRYHIYIRTFHQRCKCDLMLPSMVSHLVVGLCFVVSCSYVIYVVLLIVYVLLLNYLIICWPQLHSVQDHFVGYWSFFLLVYFWFFWNGLFFVRMLNFIFIFNIDFVLNYNYVWAVYVHQIALVWNDTIISVFKR